MRKFFRENRIYIILALFLMLMYALSFVAERSARESVQEGEGTTQVEAGKDDTAADKNIFDPKDIKEREEKLRALAQEDPKLYFFIGILNLTIVFFIFAGFIIDLYVLGRFASRKPIDLRINSPGAPEWTLGDVIRAVLVFMSCGYVFAVLQGALSGYFPLLQNGNFNMVFNTAVINIVGISVIVFFAVKKHGNTLADIGLTMARAAKGVFIAVLSYLSLLPVLMFIMVLTFLVIRWLDYTPPVQPIVRIFMEEKASSVLWLSVIFAAIFGPVAEEIFFRGFMYPAIRKRTGAFIAIFCTSAIFAALHAHIVGFFPIFALGVLLTYLYERSGSLVPSIAVHILHNMVMVSFVFLVKKAGL